MPVVDPAGDEATQGGQGRAQARRSSIGLLCSKTFDDAIFEELFEAKYGLKKADIKKMNIKGVFQIWMHNGDYHEVPLKECHQWTREGCKMCPDFAAEHADISTGGIGKYNDWTLTIVRTDAGRELMERMLADGVIEIRPGDDDPDAIALMHKLSRRVAQALARVRGGRARRRSAAPAQARADRVDDARVRARHRPHGSVEGRPRPWRASSSCVPSMRARAPTW